ncbi:hypothetical protein JL720_5788 [Aureococcus anophagefferens]|nr:hypothetical protein JL720_5788 [Aureococcus anophagefferens]
MASLAEKPPEDAPIEISMFKAPECFLYKVPPLKIASGHRAEDWGLGSPQLTGRVEIVGVGTTAEVRVFKQDDGAKPVAVCPSRYFVLRLEDAKKRKAYLGLGFRERDVAYDFKATLCDFKRSVDREEKAEADHADYERRQADGADPEAEVDMSLKGRIKISLGDDDGDRPERPQRESAGPADGAVPRLAPPPKPVPRRSPPRPAPPPAAAPPPLENWATFDGGPLAAAAADGGDDDDGGDFERAKIYRSHSASSGPELTDID